MSYSLENLLQQIRGRTAVVDDDPMLIRELNSATDWAFQKLYLVNANVSITFGTTGTLGADAQALNLGAAITTAGGTLAGLKTFWIKGTNDTDFVPAVEMDPNNPEFLALDQLTPAQVIQPVFYCVYNGDQIRFANQLPSGTQWQADWYGLPPAFALNAQCTTTLPPQIYAAIVDRACGIVFINIDDSRGEEWSQRADWRLSLAIKNIKKRQFATKRTTTPYPAKAGSAFWGPTR